MHRGLLERLFAVVLDEIGFMVFLNELLNSSTRNAFAVCRKQKVVQNIFRSAASFGHKQALSTSCSSPFLIIHPFILS